MTRSTCRASRVRRVEPWRDEPSGIRVILEWDTVVGWVVRQCVQRPL